MSRRDNQQAIAQGSGWTDVFRSDFAGGEDGAGSRGLILSCAASSSNPVEFRMVAPGDPEGEVSTLVAGETIPIVGFQQLIHHVQMRGVGGSAVGGVDEFMV